MRGLMILAGRFYVTNSPLRLDHATGCYEGSLAIGGIVYVPRDRLVAFEEYDDGEIERFRRRLKELEDARPACEETS